MKKFDDFLEKIYDYCLNHDKADTSISFYGIYYIYFYPLDNVTISLEIDSNIIDNKVKIIKSDNIDVAIKIEFVRWIKNDTEISNAIIKYVSKKELMNKIVNCIGEKGYYLVLNKSYIDFDCCNEMFKMGTIEMINKYLKDVENFVDKVVIDKKLLESYPEISL